MHRVAVLIAAHGGRDGGGRSNESIFSLARKVSACTGNVRVGVGFINGVPSIGDAVAALAARDVVIYPFFMAAGHFGKTILNQLVEVARRERQGGSIVMLPPLGADPALADFIVAKAASAVTSLGLSPKKVTLVLLAHGSVRGDASAMAAKSIAKGAGALRAFADLKVSFIDEAPGLETTVSKVEGPVAVAGLFVADGLHGTDDAKRLMARIDRSDVIYVGNVGLYSGLEKLIAAAVINAIAASEPSLEKIL